MAQVMREFEKQSGQQEMTTEMLDDLFDDPAVEAEADEGTCTSRSRCASP